MKQSEVMTGETYLFAKTEHQYKKDLVGKPFKVIGRRQRKKWYPTQLGDLVKGNRPCRYRNENGRWAKACELEVMYPSFSVLSVTEPTGGNHAMYM